MAVDDSLVPLDAASFAARTIDTVQGLNVFQRIHDAWQGGTVTTRDLRRGFIAAWVRYGAVAPHAPVLAMLRETGYLTDWPRFRLPQTMTVYRGGAEGDPIGLSWTPHADLARWYAQLAVERWALAGRSVTPQIIRGRLPGSSVLMYLHAHGEIVADPADVERVDPDEPTPSGWPVATSAEVRAIRAYASLTGGL